MIGLLIFFMSFAAFASGNANGHFNVGDGSVFATMPAGHMWPEGVVVDYYAKLVYVTQPAAGGTAGGPASSVVVFSLDTGAQLAIIPVQNEDLSQEHALVEGALGAPGEAYVPMNINFGLLPPLDDARAAKKAGKHGRRVLHAERAQRTLPPWLQEVERLTGGAAA